MLNFKLEDVYLIGYLVNIMSIFQRFFKNRIENIPPTEIPLEDILEEALEVNTLINGFYEQAESFDGNEPQEIITGIKTQFQDLKEKSQTFFKRYSNYIKADLQKTTDEKLQEAIEITQNTFQKYEKAKLYVENSEKAIKAYKEANQVFDEINKQLNDIEDALQTPNTSYKKALAIKNDEFKDSFSEIEKKASDAQKEYNYLKNTFRDLFLFKLSKDCEFKDLELERYKTDRIHNINSDARKIIKRVEEVTHQVENELEPINERFKNNVEATKNEIYKISSNLSKARNYDKLENNLHQLKRLSEKQQTSIDEHNDNISRYEQIINNYQLTDLGEKFNAIKASYTAIRQQSETNSHLISGLITELLNNRPKWEKAREDYKALETDIKRIKNNIQEHLDNLQSGTTNLENLIKAEDLIDNPPESLSQEINDVNKERNRIKKLMGNYNMDIDSEDYFKTKITQLTDNQNKILLTANKIIEKASEQLAFMLNRMTSQQIELIERKYFLERVDSYEFDLLNDGLKTELNHIISSFGNETRMSSMIEQIKDFMERNGIEFSAMGERQ